LYPFDILPNGDRLVESVAADAARQMKGNSQQPAEGGHEYDQQVQAGRQCRAHEIDNEPLAPDGSHGSIVGKMQEAGRRD
jgi:hypothetical protein